MNENAKMWVAALRSGEYRQGTDSLRTEDDCYCCLGVACDLYAKATNKRWMRENGEWMFGGHEYDLPNSVMKWLGLKSSTGAIIINGQIKKINSLSGRNDDGKKFEEIADYIESDPLGLFDEETA